MNMDESINVLGEPLLTCGENPKTGFFRDGKCNTCAEDIGSHTVCIQASEAFLNFSKIKGNDLSAPQPEYGFSGLKPGNTWCLCAARWQEARESNMAPKVHLRKTHIRALEIIPLEVLKRFAADFN